jgi:hypothetical protein
MFKCYLTMFKFFRKKFKEIIIISEFFNFQRRIIFLLGASHSAKRRGSTFLKKKKVKRSPKISGMSSVYFSSQTFWQISDKVMTRRKFDGTWKIILPKMIQFCKFDAWFDAWRRLQLFDTLSVKRQIQCNTFQGLSKTSEALMKVSFSSSQKVVTAKL